MTSRVPRNPRPGDDRRLPVGQYATAIVAVIGLAVIVVGVVLITSGGDDGEQVQPPAQETPAAQPTAQQTPTAQPTTDEVPTADDQAAIEALARSSIEVLPEGQWPTLYNAFTSDFRDRCPEAEFDQQGVQAAADLGDDLLLLGFSRVEELSVAGDSGEAVIVGELEGQGEYKIQAAFRREDGVWKIAPAADTQGCEAFSRL